MDRHVVTIAKDNIECLGEDGHVVALRKQMQCSCDWKGETQPFRAQAMATHHLNLTHGGGRIVYMNTEEIVGEKETDL